MPNNTGNYSSILVGELWHNITEPQRWLSRQLQQLAK